MRIERTEQRFRALSLAACAVVLCAFGVSSVQAQAYCAGPFTSSNAAHVTAGRASAQSTQNCSACIFGLCGFPSGCTVTTTSYTAVGSGQALGSSGSASTTLYENPAGRFSTTACTSCAASETSCTNGSDEDCDGLIDCADSQCAADAACAEACECPAGPVGPQGPAGPAGPQGPQGVPGSVDDIDASAFASGTIPRLWARLEPVQVPAGASAPILYDPAGSSHVVTNTPGFGEIVSGRFEVALEGVYLVCVNLMYNGGTLLVNGYAELGVGGPGANAYAVHRTPTTIIPTPLQVCNSVRLEAGEAPSVFVVNEGSLAFWFDLPELQMTWIAPLEGPRDPMPGE
jgi:hypothetical protein